MAYLIKVDKDNIVKQVIVGEAEFLSSVRDNEAGEWYIREERVGRGYNYNKSADIFFPPSPYPSWVLDSSYSWQAPIPKPQDSELEYVWNESRKRWESKEDLIKFELQKPYIESVQKYLDIEAQKLGYDDINSTAKYLRPSSPYYNEALELNEWCDECWSECFRILALVESGEMEIPNVEALLEMMPKRA